MGRVKVNRYFLKPEQVRAILQEPWDLSDGEVARRYNVSRWTVSCIRCGRTYADAAPDIPRRVWRSCDSCVHHRTPLDARLWDPFEHQTPAAHDCSLGIPEMHAHGTQWATFCPSYCSND